MITFEFLALNLNKTLRVPCARLLCVTDPARYCSKAARALIREMFGLAVKLVPQGCFLPPTGQDEVGPFLGF